MFVVLAGVLLLLGVSADYPVHQATDCVTGEKYVRSEKDPFVFECKEFNQTTYGIVKGCRSLNEFSFIKFGDDFDQVEKSGVTGYRYHCDYKKQILSFSVTHCLMGSPLEAKKKGEKAEINGKQCTCHLNKITCKR